MKLNADNVLYIEFSEMAEAFGAKYLTVVNTRKTKGYGITEDWEDGRRVLYCYEDMSPKNREKIQEWLRKKVQCTHAPGDDCKCGDPKYYMSSKPLRESIVIDRKAEQFYSQYRYDGPTGKSSLLPEVIRRYTLGASVLQTILDAEADKKKLIKDKFGIDIASYYERMCEIIRAWQTEGKLPNKFPTQYLTLRRALKNFASIGYPYLISPSYGNKNAAKVAGDEVKESYLQDLLDNHNQHDCKFISLLYNNWAKNNGYATITEGTVKNLLAKNKQFLKNRIGKAAINDQTRRKIVHDRPSAPLLLWESDDNTLDWKFRGDYAKDELRIKAIFIIDSHNDYIVGYAYTTGEITNELIRMAYINAAYHIKDITGNWYAPFELKTDRWAIKELQPFYENIGHYYPTPVGSKGGRWIEPFFGSTDWKRSMKWNYNNYSGNNISAKTRGVNLEGVYELKKEWPHIDEAGKQLAEHVQRLREMPIGFEEGKPSRQEQWLHDFAAMPEKYRVPMTDEQFLMKFGIEHTHTNQIRNGMVAPTILGTTYKFGVPKAYYMDNVGKTVSVKYDPYDLTRVLVSDSEHLRFTAKSIETVAGCMADMTDGGREFLNRLLATVTDEMSLAGKKAAQREKVLRTVNTDFAFLPNTEKQLRGMSETAALRELAGADNREFDMYSQM